MRARRLEIRWLCASLVVFAMAQAVGAQSESAPSDPGSWNLRLQVGPIEGLTTSWHPAPRRANIPLGATLQFRLLQPIRAEVTWSGAREVGFGSVAMAEQSFDRPGLHVVAVDFQGTGGPERESIELEVLDSAPPPLAVGEITAAVEPPVIDAANPNSATMAYYFADDSVAALRQLSTGHYRTSIVRWLTLQADTELHPLATWLEWTVNGKVQRQLGASVRVRLFVTGENEISAGPAGSAASLRLDTYRVEIVGPPDENPWLDGLPLRFAAVTDPPGLEDEITWLTSTKFGTADPVLSRGRTLLATFAGTFGETGRWLGVKADHARLGQDDKNEQAEREFPGIAPPERLPSRPQRHFPSRLPPGVGAQFPGRDGDPFFFTFPVTQRDGMTSDNVLDETIAPVLRSLGFTTGGPPLAPPAVAGVPMPKADLSLLSASLDFEALSMPQLLRPRSQKLLDVLAGRIPADAEIDAALSTGEGMTFAQFKAGVERQEILYPFRQVVEGVPIEHVGIMASRWEGQGVTSVWGSLIRHYFIGNQVVLTPPMGTLGPGTALPAALAALRRVPRIEGVPENQSSRLDLVLYPYLLDPAGSFELRYSYRIRLTALFEGQEIGFLLWLDAESGELLVLISLAANDLPSGVNARGVVAGRDPQNDPPVPVRFRVSSAQSGRYTLRLKPAFGQIDFTGDGDFEDGEVNIADDAGGSSSTLANFVQGSINDVSEAICSTGTNKHFQEMNVLANLYRYLEETIGLGIFEPFPEKEFRVSVEDPKANFGKGPCNAMNSATQELKFGYCGGYTHADCPDRSDGATSLQDTGLNFALDDGTIAHELAHSTTPRFTSTRPADWCMPAPGTPCPIPLGWGSGRFHDLADFWADHFNSTNCYSGWIAKNVGGLNHSLWCAHHSEANEIPRLHEVPGDHFPERTNPLSADGREDMQLAAAALWEVRTGMRSKCFWSGVPQFGVRFARALRQTTVFPAPISKALGTYQFYYDLLQKLVDQWDTAGSPDGPPIHIHNGPSSTNKVTAGFARAGLFLVPYQCLDSDAATTDGRQCTSGDNGADAVIDIDDNDPDDDYEIDTRRQREVDFLELSGPSPTFQVHTGPAYRFDSQGAASTANPPCNSEYRVEVSTDMDFPASEATVESGWLSVSTDPNRQPVCVGSWTPGATQWQQLQSGGAGTRIYYRATTRDASGANLRFSTKPGNGLWDVPPPYSVITADGRSDY